jgi:hypothetical protein
MKTQAITFREEKTYCPIHPEEILKYYCSCGSKVCVLCVTTHSHDKLEFSTFQEKKTSYLNEMHDIGKIIRDLNGFECDIDKPLSTLFSCVLKNVIENKLLGTEKNSHYEILDQVSDLPKDSVTMKDINDLLKENYSAKLADCHSSLVRKKIAIQKIFNEKIITFKKELETFLMRFFEIEPEESQESSYLDESSLSQNSISFQTPPSSANKINQSLINSKIDSNEKHLSLHMSDYLIDEEKSATSKNLIQELDNIFDESAKFSITPQDFNRNRINDIIYNKDTKKARQGKDMTKTCSECSIVFKVDNFTSRWKYRCDQCQKKFSMNKRVIGSSTVKKGNCITCKDSFLLDNRNPGKKKCNKCMKKYVSYNNLL